MTQQIRVTMLNSEEGKIPLGGETRLSTRIVLWLIFTFSSFKPPDHTTDLIFDNNTTILNHAFTIYISIFDISL